MEEFTLVALRLIFFRLLKTSKVLQSLSLILAGIQRFCDLLGGDSILPARGKVAVEHQLLNLYCR